MKASRIITVVVVVGLLGGFGWLAYRHANAAGVVTYRIDFTSLPESDDALREWLASQPGVLGSSVHRDGQTVVVEYVRSIWSDGPVPLLLTETQRLGYGGVRGVTGEIKGRW